MIAASLDQRLYKIILEHLDRLDVYVSKSGRVSQRDRETLYETFHDDPMYSIFGLDSPEYISAVLGGGVITSIHRKIGDLYEASVREIVSKQLGIPAGQISYSATIASGDRNLTRSIDTFISFDVLKSEDSERVHSFATGVLKRISPEPRVSLKALGFEIRHCYQSADSKRVQADEAMARHLLVSGILPVMLVFCKQSNQEILRRYRSTWVVYEGHDSYSVLRELTNYNFFSFLQKHKADFQKPVRAALRSTLGVSRGQNAKAN